MESYVLRIHRREGTRIVGLIEQTANGRQLPFHSAEELWAVLAGNDPPHANPGSARPDSVPNRRRINPKK